VADRDEIADVMRDSCRKVSEEGDSYVSAGCSCFGIKAKRTTVSVDGEGRVTTIEMVLSRAEQVAIRTRLTELYGAPRENDTWFVDDLQAVSLADGDDGIVATFTVPVIELLQYMER
jgi:hypothetical protein